MISILADLIDFTTSCRWAVFGLFAVAAWWSWTCWPRANRGPKQRLEEMQAIPPCAAAKARMVADQEIRTR